MAPPGKKNHEFVVKVRVPTITTGRRHERRQKRAKRGQNLKLSDFPADLLANLLEGLSSADRIRFGATSKNNLSLVTATATATTKHHRHQYQFRAIDELPWVATYSRDCSDTLKFSLFDARHIQGQPNYATYTIKDPKGEGFGRWGTGYTALKALNKGWLLCLWEEGKATGLTSSLLFSPFNQRIIKLPILGHGFVKNWRDHGNCQATFSSDPSSPDCIYFFLFQDCIPGIFSINTLDYQTSREWKTIVVSDNRINYVSSVLYHEGCFYCLSGTCQLAAYDVVHQSWKVIIPSCPLPNLVSRMHIMDIDILVCEGKVILVVLDTKALKDKVEMSTFYLFEFSSSTRKWVKKTSLGNHTLFLGQTSFSVPVSSSSSSDNIANRVYFYSSNNELSSFYYSLKDGQCHPSKDSGYWSSDVKRGIWIQPP